MSDCVCWKTYICLRCEDISNGIEPEKAGRVRPPRREGTNRFSVNRKIAECGTRSGYKRHRANGEEACAECKSAQNEAVKEYMKQKRAS